MLVSLLKGCDSYERGATSLKGKWRRQRFTSIVITTFITIPPMAVLLFLIHISESVNTWIELLLVIFFLQFIVVWIGWTTKRISENIE